MFSHVFYNGDHTFSMHAKFSEKLKYHSPLYAYVRERISEKEMLVFRKTLRTY